MLAGTTEPQLHTEPPEPQGAICSIRFVRTHSETLLRSPWANSLGSDNSDAVPGRLLGFSRNRVGMAGVDRTSSSQEVLMPSAEGLGRMAWLDAGPFLFANHDAWHWTEPLALNILSVDKHPPLSS